MTVVRGSGTVTVNNKSIVMQEARCRTRCMPEDIDMRGR